MKKLLLIIALIICAVIASLVILSKYNAAKYNYTDGNDELTEVNVHIMANASDGLYIRTNKDGTIEYWLGYSYSNSTEYNGEHWNFDVLSPITDFPRYGNDYIRASTMLNASEKVKLNKLAELVETSDNSEHLEYTDGLSFYLNINGTDYYSMPIIDDTMKINKSDIVINDLITALWGLRPPEIDEHFTEVNSYPKFMFKINRKNYEKYFHNKISKSPIKDEKVFRF